MMEASTAEQREIVLSGAITVETAHATKQQLLLQLTDAGPHRICAASVKDLDAAGAQLLYAFITEVARRGATVHWVAVSHALIRSARALGMHACLGLPEDGAS